MAKANALKAHLKWAMESESAKRINAALDLARSEPSIPILPEQLDRDPMLFSCPNGTIDLRTGELRPHRREDYITKLCPTEYHADAECPTWIRFLASLFPVQNHDAEPGGDDALITFIQRLLGYFLTGSVREQILPIFWGQGANGKSTLLGVLQEIMGCDYAKQAVPDLLLASQNDRHLTELADLFGKRLVICSETDAGRRLNESRVKTLTGGDKITARRMREDPWEFDPTHKCVYVSNHKPVVRGIDHGIWRRLRLVPFLVKFWDPDKGETGPPELQQDKQLPDKLKAERQGILAWMVCGCLDWQRKGLPAPKAVMQATDEYRSAEDLVQQFISECCLTGEPALRIRAGQLYERFKCWCEAAGEKSAKQKSFGEAMTDKGYQRLPNNGIWYVGITLRPQQADFDVEE